MTATYLTICATVVLILVLIIGRLVTRGLPRDDDQVSDQWLRNNAYEKKGYDK